MGFRAKGGDGNGNGNPPPPKPTKFLNCPKCGFTCTTISDLQAHISAAHPSKGPS